MNPAFSLGADGIFRCEAWSQFPWQWHGFGSRLGNPTPDVTLRQIHSDLVIDATGLADRQCEGDSIVSAETNLTIGIRTADCVPILVLDSRTHAVAATHAGWRGTAATIVPKTLQTMTQKFGTSADHVFAAIGPCIGPCCYQVGPDVVGDFVSFFPEWASSVAPTHLDLAETNRRQLIDAGVPATQIFTIDLCTACSRNELFSYRREPANPGRMLSAICRFW